jgi:hypothetical protein
LVYGTLHLSSYLCVVIRSLILHIVASIANPLLGLVSFWDIHWFPGLLANSLALPSLPLRLSMLLPLAVVRNYFVRWPLCEILA